LITVLRTGDVLAAQRAVARLEEAGIAARVVGGALPFGGVGDTHEVVVADEEAERARAVLAGETVEVAAAEERSAAVAPPMVAPKAPALELGLVLLFSAALPSVSSLDALLTPEAGSGTNLGALYTPLTALGTIGLLVLSARRAPALCAERGLVRPQAFDLVVALLLFLITLVANKWLFFSLWSLGCLDWIAGLYAGLPAPESWLWFDFGPSGAGRVLAAGASLVLVVLHAAEEELVSRSYLLPELTKRLGSRTRATLAASALFALPHLYQGPAGLLGSFLFGLVLSLAFWRLGRLTPLVLAHAGYNIFVWLG